jgi:hypothetical protein
MKRIKYTLWAKCEVSARQSGVLKRKNVHTVLCSLIYPFFTIAQIGINVSFTVVLNSLFIFKMHSDL